MQRLVYTPFKAVVRRKKRVRALTRGPFLIVLDGLDECDNRDEVQELIDGMLVFFNDNPLIPLRVFITSRVEEHIRSHLNVPGVQLDNLVDHCSDDDIATFLRILFEDGCRRNLVVQAYVQQHGEWPTQSDKRKLVEHIGGSFIFASVVFKFIMGANIEGSHPTTPMDRLPLTLKMNPGLDGLYAETLSRSKHLPYFSDIISTIALLGEPLPTSGIAELLGIDICNFVNVLVNLQAIIRVPGTDDIPVTLCHTSLRDFLTTQGRSDGLFAHPSHHVRLFLRCIECKLRLLRQNPGLFTNSSERMPAAAYVLRYSVIHLERGHGCFKLTECDSAIQLCREALALQPGNPELIGVLASVIRKRASKTKSLTELDESVSLVREALGLQPSPHPNRSIALNNLGSALLHRHRRTGTMTDIEAAISMYREALELQPFPHPGHSYALNNLANALLDHHRRTGTLADLEEAISMYRKALELRPPSDPNHSFSLNSLGNALRKRHQRTGTMADLEEAISLLREALERQPSPSPGRSKLLNGLGHVLLNHHQRTGSVADLDEAISLFCKALELRPLPHPDRLFPLCNLVISLQAMYKETHTLSHLQEAVAHCEELLEFHYTVGHQYRAKRLLDLGSLLQMRFDATGQADDLSKIATLREEANRLSASSTASTT
ncbi:hypothetical protein EST38_g4495 [Candolleomyces aberdarensis]|uniref:Nephrocystin 3-like N-terminal domain-containing protein n=1 Tax=Candolleomyces aberdarensis TaxID=2316362 RepID=A0A4Q2DR29_9AGAR|nr:hypothetical protein EST38_g4495 [Candolleomyces aberdarensis]